MPRKVKDTNLSNRTVRARLAPRPKPYWRLITEGHHLGYRRHQGTPAGSWTARILLAGGYREKVLGLADDTLPADGDKILDFAQAQDKMRVWFLAEVEKERRVESPASVEPATYTVARCMRDYLDWYSVHRKAVDTTGHVMRAHILNSPLSERLVRDLTPGEIKKWLQDLATTPARLRSGRGKQRKLRPAQLLPDEQRKRKATANRVLTILKAALNMAFQEGKVESDSAWRRVKPFKGVDAPKIIFLKQEEIARLLQHCEEDFGRLVRGALLTGCRYGELIGMRVSNLLPEIGALHIPVSKGGKSRFIYLTDEGLEFFRSLADGRPGSQFMFLKSDGEPWGRSHQERRIKTARALAGLDAAVNFHALRHTYASHYLMNGGTVPALAAQLGHADVRMTVRHYGHLADSWIAQEARVSGLRLDFSAGGRERLTAAQLAN